MSRENIIRMAREAGFKASVGKTDKDGVYHPDVNAIGRDVPIEWLERLVALVAAAECKAMLQLFTDPENQPTQHGTVTVEYMQREIDAERERICKAIKEEDDYCVTEGDYMLDSDDCIAVARGVWVRPDYSVDATQAKGRA